MAKKIPQVRVLLFNGEGIGMGFNSDSGLAVGTALDFDPPATEPGQEAQASAQIVTTHDSMMEALGVSAEAKGRRIEIGKGGMRKRVSAKKEAAEEEQSSSRERETSRSRR